MMGGVGEVKVGTFMRSSGRAFGLGGSMGRSQETRILPLFGFLAKLRVIVSSCGRNGGRRRCTKGMH
jgi:hypothetical protein